MPVFKGNDLLSGEFIRGAFGEGLVNVCSRVAVHRDHGNGLLARGRVGKLHVLVPRSQSEMQRLSRAESLCGSS